MIYISFIFFILFFIVLPFINGIISLLIIIINPKYYVLIGITIMRKNISYNYKVKSPNNDYLIKKKVGNFIFTNDNDIFVYPKLIWSGFYNIHTGFSLRLFGRIKNNSIDIKVKISFFSLIHTLLTYIGLISLIIWSIFSKQKMIITIGGILFLVTLTIGYIQTYFAIEDNYSSMINELEQIITNHNKQDYVHSVKPSH